VLSPGPPALSYRAHLNQTSEAERFFPKTSRPWIELISETQLGSANGAGISRKNAKGTKIRVRVSSTVIRKLSGGASARVVLAVGIAFGGLFSTAGGQKMQMPERSTADKRAQTVVTFPHPPVGFNPLVASDEELKRYGFPPRPDAQKAPEAYDRWRALVLVPRTANPTWRQTAIYSGPAHPKPAQSGPR
jgi:hypothetical protein